MGAHTVENCVVTGDDACTLSHVIGDDGVVSGDNASGDMTVIGVGSDTDGEDAVGDADDASDEGEVVMGAVAISVIFR